MEEIKMESSYTKYVVVYVHRKCSQINCIILSKPFCRIAKSHTVKIDQIHIHLHFFISSQRRQLSKFLERRARSILPKKSLSCLFWQQGNLLRNNDDNAARTKLLLGFTFHATTPLTSSGEEKRRKIPRLVCGSPDIV